MKIIFFFIILFSIFAFNTFAFKSDFVFFDSSGECWNCASNYKCEKCHDIRHLTGRRQCLPPTRFECSISSNINFKYPSRDLPFYFMCTLSHDYVRRECPCGRVFDFNLQCCVDYENMVTPRDLCFHDENNIRRPNHCDSNQIAEEISRNSQCLPPTVDDCCGRPRHRFPSNNLTKYYECDNSRDGFRVHQCPCDTLFNYELQSCVNIRDSGTSRCKNPTNRYPIPCSQTTERPEANPPGQNTNRPGPAPPGQTNNPGPTTPIQTTKPGPTPPGQTNRPPTPPGQTNTPTTTPSIPGQNNPTTTIPLLIPTVTKSNYPDHTTEGSNDFPTLPTNTPPTTTTTRILVPSAPILTTTTIKYPVSTEGIAIPTQTKNSGMETTEINNINRNLCVCFPWWICRCQQMCFGVPCSNVNII